MKPGNRNFQIIELPVGSVTAGYMADILLFGGTKEGRLLSEYIKETGKSAVVYVATEYGESLMEDMGQKKERKAEQENRRKNQQETGQIKVAAGRLNWQQMAEQMRHYAPKLVIDGTHPYAKEVTKNIRKACQETGCPYIRLRREEEGGHYEGIYWVEDSREAAAYLKEKEGNILLTTGSKELEEFLCIPFYEERIYVRILPVPEMVKKCLELGIQGKNLICMQGPFSKELNLAMLKEFQISYMVTKESGKAGGFPEKIAAAKEAGAKVVGIKRPREEKGCSMEEIKMRISSI